MNRNNNAKVYVEIQTPQGERIVSEYEIANKEFYNYLKPIHKNKHPFIEDDPEEIEKEYQQRESFVRFLSDKISDSFLKYFDSIDTINGYNKDKYNE